MGLWCSWFNIPLLQSGDEKYNVGSNPTRPTKKQNNGSTGRGFNPHRNYKNMAPCPSGFRGQSATLLTLVRSQQVLLKMPIQLNRQSANLVGWRLRVQFPLLAQMLVSHRGRLRVPCKYKFHIAGSNPATSSKKRHLLIKKSFLF